MTLKKLCELAWIPFVTLTVVLAIGGSCCLGAVLIEAHHQVETGVGGAP